MSLSISTRKCRRLISNIDGSRFRGSRFRVRFRGSRFGFKVRSRCAERRAPSAQRRIPSRPEPRAESRVRVPVRVPSRVRSAMRLFQLPAGVLVEADGGWFRLSGESWDSVVNRDDLHDWISGRMAKATLTDAAPDLARAPAAGRRAGGVGRRRDLLPQPHGADGGVEIGGRRRFLRSGLRRGASRAVLQGDAPSRPRPRPAGSHPQGFALERAGAGARAGGELATGPSSATPSATT